MALDVFLRLVNPANPLHVDIGISGLDDPDLGYEPGEIYLRQFLPLPVVDFGRFPAAAPSIIILFAGDPAATFVLNAVVYASNGAPQLSIMWDYSPSERRRASASGSATSGGSVALPRWLVGRASGSATSSGSADVRQRGPIGASGSGSGGSGGSAYLIVRGPSARNVASLGPVWRFVAVARYPSNRSQGDLSDARSRQIAFSLGAPCSLGLVLPGRSPHLAWLEELRSDVIAYRWSDAVGDFVPMFRGVVNRSEDELSPTVHTVVIGAIDYRGVLSRRNLRAPASWAQTEQLQIALALAMAGDQPPGVPAGGRLGLSHALLDPSGLPIAGSGRLRDRAYVPGQKIGEAIDNMSTDIDGFDWSVDPGPDPGLAGIVNFWYPRRGVARSTWVAHYGSTVTNVARVVSTTTYTNYAMVLGATVPDSEPAETMFAESFGPGYADPIGHPEGPWMSVNAQPDVSQMQTLQDDADGFVATYGDLEPAYTLELAPGRWSPDDAWLGDTVRLIVDSGRLAVDTAVRITAIDVTVDDLGRETVTLTAGLPPSSASQLLRAIDRRLDKLEAR